jgi:hypothetical protein
MWGCFLGCSWTWVIGMYFPVLLLRDYGVWGWVAFAVPNVLGAAAMGFVLKNPDVSRRVVEKHRAACLAFSQITIAYQIYMVTAFTGLAAWPILLAVAFGFLFAGRGGSARDGVVAAGVWAVSLIAFGYLQTRGWLWLDASESLELFRLSTTHLLMFIPASVFGFALCPYLDLTFHRARQATDPVTGRAAFALGFGVVFLSMIVFSLAYAGAMWWLPPEGPGQGQGFDIHQSVWRVFKWHLLIQTAFTIAVHWRSIDSTTCGYNLRRKLTLAVVAGLLAVVAGLLAVAALYRFTDGFYEPDRGMPLSTIELVYRLFLLLYGTVFPAYVLLCMIPTYRQVSHKAKICVFAVAATLSYPLAYIAFIANRSLWVLAIFAVMVIARIVIELLPSVQTLSPRP